MNDLLYHLPLLHLVASYISLPFLVFYNENPCFAHHPKLNKIEKELYPKKPDLIVSNTLFNLPPT